MLSRRPSFTWLNSAFVLATFVSLALIGSVQLSAQEKAPKGEAHQDSHAGKGEGASHAGAAPSSAHGSDASHGADHGDETSPSPIDWKADLALWTLVTFGLFCVVLRAVAWTPMMSALDSREKRIRSDIESAEQNRIKAEKMLAEYQSKLQAAQDEVLKILAEARRDAEHTRQEIMSQTESDVTSMKNRALTEINLTKDKALEELFSHLNSSVTAATEKVLGRALTDADQDRLVNEALTEFSRQQAS